MANDPKETKLYRFLCRIIKMEQRDSRREFVLLLLGITLFLISLAAQFWSSDMPMIAHFFLGLSIAAFAIYITFHIYAKKHDFGDPQENTLKKILDTLERIEKKLDREKPDDKPKL